MRKYGSEVNVGPMIHASLRRYYEEGGDNCNFTHGNLTPSRYLTNMIGIQIYNQNPETQGMYRGG